MRLGIPICAMATVVLTGGCGSAPPLRELGESRAAVIHAIAAGAERAAPRELALAREKIRLGERWMRASDYTPARWLVEQARVDAELAEVKAVVQAQRAGTDPR